MHTDATEQLNRYLSTVFKADGAYYQDSDKQLSIIIKSGQPLHENATSSINELKRFIGNSRLLVSNWFDISTFGDRIILTMTYRVM